MLVLIIRAVIVFVMLNLGLRITGKRQIGELELSELITTLLLSELASTPIADPDIPLINAIAPIFFLSALEIVITYVTSRNSRVKAVIDGVPSVVIRNGRIEQSELAKIRMSCQELLGQLRRQGVGDPREVKYALFEEDGNLSVFPVDNPSGNIVHAMFADGSICANDLALCGRDESWIDGIIADSGYARKDIFLIAANDAGEHFVIPKEKR